MKNRIGTSGMDAIQLEGAELPYHVHISVYA
jgi:hypothetical protein